MANNRFMKGPFLEIVSFRAGEARRGIPRPNPLTAAWQGIPLRPSPRRGCGGAE